MGLGIITGNDQINADDVRGRMRGHEGNVVRAYRGEPNRKLSNGREMRWGSHGSFKLNLSGRHAGLWYDHELGVGGDVFSFIMREQGCTFVEALRIAADFCGGVTNRRQITSVPRRDADQTVKEVLEAEIRVSGAFAIWEQSRPLSGTLAEVYLCDVRRYELPEFVDDALRFHSSCPWEHGTVPALVAAIKDIVTDEIIGIHRTALDSAGRKLGRKVLGLAGGGAIKLWPHSELRSMLCIGEGIETSLGGYALLGLHPVWSVLNAGNMGRFPLLREIQHLDVLVDHDVAGAGEQAAFAVEQRYRAAGRTVALYKPDEPGRDMDNEWRDSGVTQ